MVDDPKSIPRKNWVIKNDRFVINFDGFSEITQYFEVFIEIIDCIVKLLNFLISVYAQLN